MYIFSTFKYSPKIELVISELEKMGVKNENMLAVPLDKRAYKAKLFDTMDYSDGVSLIDLSFILGCIFMLLGSIYGFVVEIGPIFLALIGLVLGLLLGFFIKLIYIKKNKEPFSLKGNNYRSEVILMIKCNNEEHDLIVDILWGHCALGVSTVNMINPQEISPKNSHHPI